jgi:hypothetical protein
LKLFLYIQNELIVDFAFAVGACSCSRCPGRRSRRSTSSQVRATVLLSFLPFLLANLLPCCRWASCSRWS